MATSEKIINLHKFLAQKFWTDLTKYVYLYKGSITSFLRSVKHNKKIPNASPTSWHLDLLAADVIFYDKNLLIILKIKCL